ncbi:MAG: hypothetical protein LBS22_02865 [Puniceicoccales bacterium]|nr:hypothetical protein [Puniceicoccales bacterium]
MRGLIAGQGIKTLPCYAYISITKYQKLVLKKASSKPSKPPILPKTSDKGLLDYNLDIYAVNLRDTPESLNSRVALLALIPLISLFPV